MSVPETHECPRCGAPLPKSSGGSIVCKYCRVTVNLPERPLPTHRHPVRQSSSLPGWAKPWLKVETVFAMVLGLGMAAWQFTKHWDVPRTPPPELPELPHGDNPHDQRPVRQLPIERQARRIVGKPLSVVGTGASHLVVAIANFADGADQLWLAAWTGAGELMWRWALPVGADSANSERAVLDGSILVRTSELVVRIDAGTGKVVWTGGAPSPAGRLCATKAYVAVKAERPPTRALERETGAPLTVKSGQCEPLYSSEDAAPNFRYLAATAPELSKRPKDFTVVRGLLPKQGNARVALGTKGAESTPTVAVVAGDRWVWQQEVSDYAVAQWPNPALAAVRRESVLVPFWDVQNQALRLAAFHLTNGERLWETALTDRRTVRTDLELDVSVTLDGVVLVVFDGRMQAYSLSNGALQWSLGGP